MTDAEKKLIRVFLERAAMANNEAVADALWMDPDELRITARQLIQRIVKKGGGSGEQ